MKFFIDNWALIAMAFVSGAMLVWPMVQRGRGAGSLTASGAVLLMNHEKAVVIDVCEPSEFAAGHVKGARNVPLGQLEQQLPTIVKNKATPVILVCASGMRSSRAVSTARKLGYEHAHSLAGGMRSWREAALPVEKD